MENVLILREVAMAALPAWRPLGNEMLITGLEIKPGRILSPLKLEDPK